MLSAWQHKPWWLRLIAITLVIAFIHQDIVWAQEGTPVWSKQSAGGPFNVKAPLNNNNLNANVDIPKDVATVKEVYNSRGASSKDQVAKTIIQIQDAHASLGAQESISQVLDSLVTNYDLKLVAIEGSSGYIDTSILKTFPDEKIRNSTAKSLMARGKMSAGEFYSITSNKTIALYGIEDKPLYKENLDQFRKIYEVNQSVSKDIDNLLKTLNQIEDNIYSPELKALESNSVLKKDGSLSFTDRWNYVSALAKKVGIVIHNSSSPLRVSYAVDNYPNLSKLEESIKLEKSISFDSANKERDALIDAISKTAMKQDLEKLVLKSLSFKQNKISQGEYYLFLQGLAKEYSIDPAPYKNLIKFTDYITLYESIDLLEIFEEAKLLEDAIKDKLYTSPDQRKLHDILKCVNSLKDIFELKLTNSDFSELEKSLQTINAESIADFIHNSSAPLRVRYAVDNSDLAPRGARSLDNIYSNLPIAIDFYKTAEKRNQAILQNTIDRMNKEGQTVAALITGGYHTKGISDLLKAKETSYLVILPKFDASKPDRPYVAILTNKADNYSEELESGKYKILTEDCLENSLQDPRAIETFIDDIITTNLKEAKKDGKNVHAIAELWIANYTANYEELVKKGIVRILPGQSMSTTIADPARDQGKTVNMGDTTLAGAGAFITPPPDKVSARINEVADRVEPRSFTPKTQQARAESVAIVLPILIKRLQSDPEIARDPVRFDETFDTQFVKKCRSLGLDPEKVDRESIRSTVRAVLPNPEAAAPVASRLEKPALPVAAPQNPPSLPPAAAAVTAPSTSPVSEQNEAVSGKASFVSAFKYALTPFQRIWAGFLSRAIRRIFKKEESAPAEIVKTQPAPATASATLDFYMEKTPLCEQIRKVENGNIAKPEGYVWGEGKFNRLGHIRHVVNSLDAIANDNLDMFSSNPYRNPASNMGEETFRKISALYTSLSEEYREILRIAGALHDYARFFPEVAARDHYNSGADMAAAALNKLGYSVSLITRVRSLIEHHADPRNFSNGQHPDIGDINNDKNLLVALVLLGIADIQSSGDCALTQEMADKILSMVTPVMSVLQTAAKTRGAGTRNARVHPVLWLAMTIISSISWYFSSGAPGLDTVIHDPGYLTFGGLASLIFFMWAVFFPRDWRFTTSAHERDLDAARTVLESVQNMGKKHIRLNSPQGQEIYQNVLLAVTALAGVVANSEDYYERRDAIRLLEKLNDTRQIRGEIANILNKRADDLNKKVASDARVALKRLGWTIGWKHIVFIALAVIIVWAVVMHWNSAVAQMLTGVGILSVFSFGKSRQWRTEDLNPRLDQAILAKIEPFKERHIVIGDLHGVSPDVLKELLQHMKFIDAKGRIIASDTTIVIQGDIIDRGQHSLELLKYVKALQAEAANAAAKNCKVVILLGNHEFMFYAGVRKELRLSDDALTNWLSHLADAGDESAMELYSEYAVLKRPIGTIRGRVIYNSEWMTLFREIEDGIESGGIQICYRKNGMSFIHGGYGPDFAGLSAQKAEERVNGDFAAYLGGSITYADYFRLHGTVWNGFYRGEEIEVDDKSKKNDIITGEGIDFLQVVGHRDTSGGVMISEHGNVIDTDIGFSELYGSSAGCLEIYYDEKSRSNRLLWHQVNRSDKERIEATRNALLSIFNRALSRIEKLVNNDPEYKLAEGLTEDERYKIADYEIDYMSDRVEQWLEKNVITREEGRALNKLLNAQFAKLLGIVVEKAANRLHVSAGQVDAGAIIKELQSLPPGQRYEKRDVRDVIDLETGDFKPRRKPTGLDLKIMKDLADIVQRCIAAQFGKGRLIERGEYLKLLEAIAAKMVPAILLAAGITWLAFALFGGAASFRPIAQALSMSFVVFSMAVIGRQNGGEGENAEQPEKILGDVGTANVNTVEFYKGYLRERIKRDIASGRFIRLKITPMGLEKDIEGSKASHFDQKLDDKISEVSEHGRLAQYLAENVEFVGVEIDLVEPAPENSRTSLHPHLLAVSGMARDWAVAHSGLRGWMGHELAAHIYMRRAFFLDADTDILAEVFIRQLEFLRAKYNAFKKQQYMPRGVVEADERLLNSIKKLIPAIKNEAEAVRIYDFRMSAEYIFRKEIIDESVKLINEFARKKFFDQRDHRRKALKEKAAIQRLCGDIKSFGDFIEEGDLDMAIDVWGRITYEIKMLSMRQDEVGDLIRTEPSMLMFNGVASGISQVIEGYVHDKGLRNQEGILSEKSIGRLVIIDDPDDVIKRLVEAKGDEIWVVPYMPAGISTFRGQGLIISVNGLDHSLQTAASQGVPFAIVPNGIELLKHFDGEDNIMMRVEDDGTARIRRATEEEIAEKDKLLKIPRARTMHVPEALVGKEVSYDLSDVDQTHLCYVGPKAANVGTMKQAGIIVPDGFVLTYAAWDIFERHNNLKQKMAALQGKINAPEEIKKAIEAGEIPAELKSLVLNKIAALREEYKDLCGSGFSFYVRSSFNLEDLPEIETDGCYETYPNTEKGMPSVESPEEIFTAIKKVWASKWNPIACKLRADQHIGDDKVLPAVLIQIPVKAKVSGNMLTARLLGETRNRGKIRGCYGQGSGLMDMPGAPASAEWYKYTQRVDIEHDSEQDQADLFENGILETLDIPTASPPVLTRPLCLRLAEMGEKIENSFDYNPQRIEWALGKDGRLYFIQAAPMDKFQSYEVRCADGLTYGDYLRMLGDIDEEFLARVVSLSKNKDMSGLIDMLMEAGYLKDPDKRESHQVAILIWLNSLMNNPEISNEMNEEQIERLMALTENSLDIRWVSSLYIGILAKIRNKVLLDEVKEFFENHLCDLIVERLYRAGITHLALLAALKASVELGIPDEAIRMAQALYKKNLEKDKTFAYKILARLLNFHDPRLIPILRQFEKDFTGDIRELAVNMINRIENRQSASSSALRRIFGEHYSPFYHAPIIEEGFKTGMPMWLALTGSPAIFWASSLITGTIFFILHILNKQAPPRTFREYCNLLTAPFAAFALGLIPMALSFYLNSSIINISVATSINMLLHYGINRAVLEYNARAIAKRGVSLKTARLIARTTLQGPAKYAVVTRGEVSLEEAIADIRNWKEANQNILNERGVNPFLTKLQEEAQAVYDAHKLYLLPFESRITFCREVFDEKNFAQTRKLINVVLGNLSVNRESVASILPPRDYHQIANLLSSLYNDYSIEDNKNVRFAFNSILFDFFPKEKRVIELQWLVKEIEREQAHPGAGKLPTVAVLQDIHGGSKRASSLIAYSLGLDAERSSSVKSVEQLKSALAEAGIDITKKDVRLVGLNDKYDRGEDPVGTFELVSWLDSVHKAKPFIGNHDFWRTMAALGVHLIFGETLPAVDYKSDDAKTHHIAYWARDAFKHAGWGNIELDEINEKRFNDEIERVNIILRLHGLPLLGGINLAEQRKSTDAALKKLKKENAAIRAANEKRVIDEGPGCGRDPEKPLPDIFTNTLTYLNDQIAARNAEIATINSANSLDIKPIMIRIANMDNYREDPDVIARTLWELHDFRLFYVDILGNLHMHNVVPFDFEHKKIDVTYKGVSGLAALELMQEDIRIFFANMRTIPDSRAFRAKMWETLGEAFTIINSWYSDKTASAKAVAVKKFIDAGGTEGFGGAILGFPVEEFSPRPVSSFMIIGHNERKKFTEPATALPYIYPFPRTGSGVILVDYEMSEGYSNRGAVLTFFKRDEQGKVTGLRLWGYASPDSEKIEDLTLKDIEGLNDEQGQFLGTLSDGASFMEWFHRKALQEISDLSGELITEARAKGRGAKEAYLSTIKSSVDEKLSHENGLDNPSEQIKKKIIANIKQIATSLILESNIELRGKYNILGLVIDDVQLRNMIARVTGKITVTVIAREFNKDCIDPFLIRISQKLRELGFDLPVVQKPYWILRYMHDDNFKYIQDNPDIVIAGEELRQIIEKKRSQQENPPKSGIAETLRDLRNTGLGALLAVLIPTLSGGLFMAGRRGHGYGYGWRPLSKKASFAAGEALPTESAGLARFGIDLYNAAETLRSFSELPTARLEDEEAVEFGLLQDMLKDLMSACYDLSNLLEWDMSHANNNERAKLFKDRIEKIRAIKEYFRLPNKKPKEDIPSVCVLDQINIVLAIIGKQKNMPLINMRYIDDIRDDIARAAQAISEISRIVSDIDPTMEPGAGPANPQAPGGAGMIPVLRWLLNIGVNRGWYSKTTAVIIQTVTEQIGFMALAHAFSSAGWYGGPVGSIFVAWTLFALAHLWELGRVKAPSWNLILNIWAINVFTSLAIMPFNCSTGLLLSMAQSAVVTLTHLWLNFKHLRPENKEPANASAEIFPWLKKHILIAYIILIANSFTPWISGFMLLSVVFSGAWAVLKEPKKTPSKPAFIGKYAVVDGHPVSYDEQSNKLSGLLKDLETGKVIDLAEARMEKASFGEMQHRLGPVYKSTKNYFIKKFIRIFLVLHNQFVKDVLIVNHRYAPILSFSMPGLIVISKSLYHNNLALLHEISHAVIDRDPGLAIDIYDHLGLAAPDKLFAMLNKVSEIRGVDSAHINHIRHHYLLRALFWHVFGEEDRALTAVIKSSKKATVPARERLLAEAKAAYIDGMDCLCSGRSSRKYDETQLSRAIKCFALSAQKHLELARLYGQTPESSEAFNSLRAEIVRAAGTISKMDKGRLHEECSAILDRCIECVLEIESIVKGRNPAKTIVLIGIAVLAITVVAAFLRNYIYFPSGALPYLAKVVGLAGFGAGAFAITWVKRSPLIMLEDRGSLLPRERTAVAVIRQSPARLCGAEKANLPFWYAKEDVRILLARKSLNKEIMGYAFYKISSDGELEIIDMSVSQQWIDLGVTEKLIKELKEMADMGNCNRVSAWVKQEMNERIGFLRKHGFVEEYSSNAGKDPMRKMTYYPKETFYDTPTGGWWENTSDFNSYPALLPVFAFASGYPWWVTAVTLCAFAVAAVIIGKNAQGSGGLDKRDMQVMSNEEYTKPQTLVIDINSLQEGKTTVWLMRTGDDGRRFPPEVCYVEKVDREKGRVTLYKYENHDKAGGRATQSYIGEANRISPKIKDEIYIAESKYDKAIGLIEGGRYQEAIDMLRPLVAVNKAMAEHIIQRARVLREKAERAAIAARRLGHSSATNLVEILFAEWNNRHLINLRERINKLWNDATNIAINEDRLPTPAETKEFKARLKRFKKEVAMLLKAEESVYERAKNTRISEDVRTRIAEDVTKLKHIIAVLKNSIEIAEGSVKINGDKVVDLARLVKEAYDRATKDNKYFRNITIAFMPDNLLRASIDKMSAVNMLAGTIENAVMAATLKNGQEKMEVTIGLRKNGGYAEIVIKDNGAGIPAEFMREELVGYRGALRKRLAFQDLDVTTNRKGGGVGTTETWYAVADHDGEMDVTTATEGDTGTTIKIKLPLKGSKRHAVKTPDLVIGIPAGTDEEAPATAARIEAIKKAVGRGCVVVVVKDASDFAGKTEKGFANIFVDNDIDVGTIGPLAQLITDYRGILVMRDIDSKAREDIAKAIEALLGKIVDKSPAEIFGIVTQALAENPGLRDEINKLRTPIRSHIKAVSVEPLYNDASIIKDERVTASDKKVGVVATEKIALNNPAFAADMEDVIAVKGEAGFVYGNDIEEEKVNQFLLETGLSQESINKIKFVKRTKDSTLEDIEKEIAAKMPGVDPSNIGIAIAPGEFDGKADKMRVLEVKKVTINGDEVLLALNAGKVLFRMLKLIDNLPAESGALDNILPGLAFDAGSKRFTYLPPMIPRDIAREVEIYRAAVLLLSSSA